MKFPGTRIRFVSACAAVSILLIGPVPSRVAAQPSYDFILVEAFDDTYDLREVYLTDVNESGIACGTSTYGSNYGGFVWTAGTGKQLVPITWPKGINNQSQIVGGNAVHDFVTGQTTIVPPVGYPLTRLLGINDNGIAVGFAECNCSNSDGVVQTALVWDVANGSRATDVLGARELVRINNDNVAVGNIRYSAGASEAFVYDVDTGASTNLSDLLPPPPCCRPWSEAADINLDGAVCGQAYDGMITRGMVWSPASGFAYLPGLEGGDPMRVHPMGMNDAGTVVGRALSGATGDWDAFIWDPLNGMRSLDTLVDAPGTFTTDWATEISEDGWIVGIGHYGPGWGTSRGYVLIPVLASTSAPRPARAGEDIALRLAPNPAGRFVDIRWSVPADRVDRLRVVDIAGRVVADLLAANGSAATADRVSWIVPDAIPAGVYFVRLESGGIATGRRLVLIR